MTTYTITGEQLATVLTAQKQFLDHGDSQAASLLDWAVTAEPATFENAIRPAIKWLNDNCNPHAAVIVTNTDAELMTGDLYFKTEDYLKD
ncbi:hypothetical protein ACFJIX_17840 [Roseateles sp. UC29_93]|uniref:hypothetical protein n=1 Tax=Roseateles sp. UC29_93 TaxID=3350177 RepID=UPI00366BAF4E